MREYYEKLYADQLDNLERRNGQLSRKIQPSKADPGRNRKFEQTNYEQGNWYW